VVPTIVFSPQSFGAETAVDGGGTKLTNVTYELLFWGSYWGTSAGNTELWRDVGLARSLSQTTYFSGLQPYLGSSPTVGMAANPYQDLSTSAPTGPIGDATLHSEVSNLVSGAITNGLLPQPRAFGNSVPIYVVVTPPGSIDNLPASQGGGTASGWNLNVSGVVYPQYGDNRAELGNAEVIWVSDFVTADNFTVNLGHESAEIMTDPHQDASGVLVTSTNPTSQICDNAARNLNYRLNGVMVQSYWSQSMGAFIVPDGNSYEFFVSGGGHSQFSAGQGSTLGIRGGQAGFTTDDTVTVNRAPDGAVTATYDGQTVQFDDGAITDVSIYEAGIGSLIVNITGTWSGSDVFKPPITVNGSPLSATTINITPDSGGLADLPDGLVSVIGASKNLTVFLNDQADTGDHDWVLNGPSIIAADNDPVVNSFFPPSLVCLKTGSGMNNVDVESAPCPVWVDDRINNSGTISFAEIKQSLAAIQNTVTLFGGASALNLYDQADTSNQVVLFDYGQFGQSDMPFGFDIAAIDSVTYYAGTGVDTFGVATFSGTLDSVGPNLTLDGGGSDTLAVNDSQHAAPTLPSHATGRQDSYTLTGQSITKTSNVWYKSTLTTGTESVSYSGMGGGVTFRADNYGTPVSIEGSSTTTKVALGSASTDVVVDQQSQSLQNLPGRLDITSAAAGSSLTVYDQQDPGGSVPLAAPSYLLAAGTITRTDYYLDIKSFPPLPVTTTRTIDYPASGMASVTIYTDNKGTAVDVEGTSTTTNLSLGTARTAVAVDLRSQSLQNLAGPLDITSAASGSSLTVYDQQDPGDPPAFAPSSYLLGASAITRTDYHVDIESFPPVPVAATRVIDYPTSGMASVTIYTDNKGTAVDMAGTSTKTTINVGSANTAVTVESVGKNLGAELKIVGGTGTNTLYAPATANTWRLTGSNAGTLDGSVGFTHFANLDGGGVSDSFDFSPGGSITGSISAGSGNNWLNYARLSTAVTVNLVTGSATDVGGTVSGIEGVVGGSGANTLTGSRRSLLIGGKGSSKLSGGAGDNLMIAGSTKYDLKDAALDAILAEWDRTDLSFAKRIKDLSDGGGLNGSNVLTLKTVSSNNKSNTITSNNAGDSWIFARHSDTIKNRKKGDVVVYL
jgi:hypothetical protein